MDYQVIVGPPAYSAEDYPEPQPVEDSRIMSTGLVVLLTGFLVAVALLATALWANNMPDIRSGAPAVRVTPTETREAPAPTPTAVWVVPDLPDTQTASTDARFVAILARHGITPAPGGSEQKMLNGAREICADLVAGWTVSQLQTELSRTQVNLTSLQTEVIVDTAVDLYCPAQKN